MKYKLFILTLIISSVLSTNAQELSFDEKIDSFNTILKGNPQFINEKIKGMQVTEIFGIKFGSSMDEVSKKMKAKYGNPSRTNGFNITYEGLRYAGIWFDDIFLKFQSDGVKTYFNYCIFGIRCKTLNEAWEKQKRLAELLEKKYYVYWVDENSPRPGFAACISPLYSNKSQIAEDVFELANEIIKNCGITCDIIDISEMSGTPYSVRLMYGPYEYVKEEF